MSGIHRENVVKSKIQQLDIPKDLTVQKLIWSNSSRWAEKIAVECAESKQRYTFKQLHEKSLHVTRFLKNKLNFQETVCIILPNVPEYPIILMGSLQAGLRVTTCNPSYKSVEIEFQLMNSDTKIIFTTVDLLPIIKEIDEDLGNSILVVVLNLYSKVVENPELYMDFQEIFAEETTGFEAEAEAHVNCEDVAFLLYSSGTTGLPKAVELTHQNVVSNLYQKMSPEFETYRDTTAIFQDVSPSILPFFHVYGMVSCLLHPLVRGSKLITFSKFRSETFINILQEYKPTIIKFVPSIAHLIINNPKISADNFKSVRVFVTGGAPLGSEDKERFFNKVGRHVTLIQGYGMTEASPLILKQSSVLPHGIKLGGSGLLLPNTEAKIIPSDGSSIQGLGPYEHGELIIRGPQVMKGYYRNFKATAEVFLEGGWLKTGDVAYYDEHEHFFVTDRLKELIKVKGFQVAPAELEEVLRGHPDVREAAVVGIPHPVFGEAPKAFVVLKSKDCTTSALGLQEFVGSKLVEHKRLAGGVVFMDEIPKGASGKFLRRELKQL